MFMFIGVPPGSILEQILCNMYVNDMYKDLQNLFVNPCADDTVYAYGTSLEEMATTLKNLSSTKNLKAKFQRKHKSPSLSRIIILKMQHLARVKFNVENFKCKNAGIDD